MIIVDRHHVHLNNDDGVITNELALFLHVMRTEYPDLLLEAMELEDRLYNMTKKGK